MDYIFLNIITVLGALTGIFFCISNIVLHSSSKDGSTSKSTLVSKYRKMLLKSEVVFVILLVVGAIGYGFTFSKHDLFFPLGLFFLAILFAFSRIYGYVKYKLIYTLVESESKNSLH